MTTDITVNEFIRRHPAAVAVFSRYGIDACCGGGLQIGEAARRHGIDVELLLGELAAVAGSDGVASPTTH